MKKCVNFCESISKRWWCVLFDGTVVSPSYDMIYGLVDTPALVGHVGALPGEEVDLCIQKFDDKIPLDESTDMMSTESLSFLIKRIDSDKQTWDSCMYSYKPKGLTKDVMITMLGSYLNVATSANKGLPPLCISSDAHGNSKYCNMVLNGVLDPVFMLEFEFFEDSRTVYSTRQHITKLFLASNHFKLHFHSISRTNTPQSHSIPTPYCVAHHSSRSVPRIAARSRFHYLAAHGVSCYTVASFQSSAIAMEHMARRILCKVTKAPKIFEHVAHLFRSCLAC